MNTERLPTSARAFETLRRLPRRQRKTQSCEVCTAGIGDDHPHLLEAVNRKLLCVCEACAVLLGGHAGKYRRVPQRIVPLPGFHLTDAQWESLQIPIGLTFIFHSSAAERFMALYPGPAGATESLLPLDIWKDVMRQNPVLASMETDVEALLINRIGGAPGRVERPQYFLLPIDQCFRLVGLIRTHWRGFSGGAEVWQQIARFFAALPQQPTTTGGARCPS